MYGSEKVKLAQKLYIRTHMYMYSFDILTCKIHFTDTQYTNTLIIVPSPLRLFSQFSHNINTV